MAGPRFARAIAQAERHSQVQMKIVRARQQLDRPPIRRNRFVEPSQRAVDLAKIGMVNRLAGAKLDRAKSVQVQ